MSPMATAPPAAPVPSSSPFDGPGTRPRRSSSKSPRRALTELAVVGSAVALLAVAASVTTVSGARGARAALAEP